jgi:hypothetical protein
VEYLINEKKADPNIQDNNKKTPLDLAQDQENDDLKKIVDILLNQQIQSSYCKIHPLPYLDYYKKGYIRVNGAMLQLTTRYANCNG